jgi:hypothetical protein
MYSVTFHSFLPSYFKQSKQRILVWFHYIPLHTVLFHQSKHSLILLLTLNAFVNFSGFQLFDNKFIFVHASLILQT